MKGLSIFHPEVYKISSNRVWTSILEVFYGSCILALLSQICIPLSPVPITGQTLAVMIVAAMFGKQNGVLAILLYLFEGAVGFPVFAGGSSGVHILLGAHAGYFFGFVIQAYIIGVLLEEETHFRAFKVVSAFLFSSLVQLALGAFWLSYFIGMKLAITLGFYPFILVGLLKIILATIYLKSNEKRDSHLSR